MVELTDPASLPEALLALLVEQPALPPVSTAPKKSGLLASTGPAWGDEKTAFDRVREALEARGHQLKKTGKGYITNCPAHDDHDPSLHVTPKPGRVLLRCFGGCQTETIVASLGLRLGDLFDVAPEQDNPFPPVETVAPADGAHPWDACCHTLESFTATPPPPTRLLIAGLLEAASLGVVSGRPGSLKTMMMMWLLLHIAAGRDVFGRRVEQANVILIDVDNGRRRMHRRMYALARALGISSAPVKTFVFPKINLSSPESVALLESLVRREKAGIVLIDTFVHASGAEDENDAAQLTGPLYATRRIVDTTDCSIMLVHHPSKAGSPLRGSSAIEGAVDLGLIVERPDKSKPLINVSTFKTRDAVVEPFSLNWHFETDQMGELVGGSFTEVEKDEETLNALHHRLVEELAEGGAGGLNALTRRLHCNKNALATLLARLVSVGAVTVAPGPRGGKTYGLSSGK